MSEEKKDSPRPDKVSMTPSEVPKPLLKAESFYKEKFEHKEKFEVKETLEKSPAVEGKIFYESKLFHEGKHYKPEVEGQIKDLSEGGAFGRPGGPIEQRLQAIEENLAALHHFITGAQRPDSTHGALAQEPDRAKTRE